MQQFTVFHILISTPPQDETKPQAGSLVTNILEGAQSPVSIKGMSTLSNRVRLPLDGDKTNCPSVNPDSLPAASKCS
jgi:hypothetical protein